MCFFPEKTASWRVGAAAWPAAGAWRLNVDHDADSSTFLSIPSPPPQRVQLLTGQQRGERDRRRRGVDHLALLHHRLPLPNSWAAWRSWPRSSATSEATPGAVRVTKRSASLPLESRRSIPLARRGYQPCPHPADRGSGRGRRAADPAAFGGPRRGNRIAASEHASGERRGSVAPPLVIRGARSYEMLVQRINRRMDAGGSPSELRGRGRRRLHPCCSSPGRLAHQPDNSAG
jgi:hypothetical protein